MNVKQSVAVIVPGGFGTGKNNAGIPVLEGIVTQLSLRFHIVVFQLFRMNSDYHPNGFEVVEVTSAWSIFRIAKFLIKFRAQHRRRHFIAVHGFWALPGGLLAMMAGKVWRIKSIVSVLGGDAIALPALRYGQLNAFLSRRLVFFTLRNAHCVNALTQYLVENLRKAGFERKEMEVIPWGVDAGSFFYSEKRIEGKVHFLHVANLHAVKDQATLLRAFELIQRQIKCDLTIIGEGEAKADVLSLINELQLAGNVFMKDPMTYSQLPAMYHRSDILLHTSLSEGQSEVVTEAMSTGLVVCGTKVGLIYDLENCCVGVPVGNYEALAAETLRLLANSGRMTILRQRAHEWTKDHTIQWTAERLGDIYDKD